MSSPPCPLTWETFVEDWFGGFVPSAVLERVLVVLEPHRFDEAKFDEFDEAGDSWRSWSYYAWMLIPEAAREEAARGRREQLTLGPVIPARHSRGIGLGMAVIALQHAIDEDHHRAQACPLRR